MSTTSLVAHTCSQCEDVHFTHEPGDLADELNADPTPNETAQLTALEEHYAFIDSMIQNAYEIMPRYNDESLKVRFIANYMFLLGQKHRD